MTKLASLAILCTLVGSAGADPDKLTAEDIKVILDEHKGDKGNPAAEQHMLDAYGIDLPHGTAKVLAKHRAHKKWFMENLMKATGDGGKNYRNIVEMCGIKPAIDIDMGVVVDTPIDDVALPVDNILEAIWQSCGNGSPDILEVNRAFWKNVKSIHFTLALRPDKPDEASFRFNKKTGELTVGCRIYGMYNNDQILRAWLSKQ